MPKITKRVVDAATPDQDRRYILWDDQIKGFGLLVLPSGVKSYLFQYRNADGIDRRATIAKHGAMTPDEARAKADDMRRAVATGKDPLAEKQARVKAVTVADLLDAYLESDTFKEKAETTRLTDEGRIRVHIRPLVGKVKAEAVTYDTLKKLLADIRDGKSAKMDGKPIRVKVKPRGVSRPTGGDGAARKSVRLLKAIYSWGKQEGKITTNPTDGFKTGSDGSRETYLEDSNAYGRLFRVLETMVEEKRLASDAAAAFKLIALTGARRGEIAKLKWAHVDLRGGQISIPKQSHKTGAKTGKPRVILLPAVAAAIIDAQPRGKADDFVFKPSKGEGAISLSKPWRSVRTEAALPEGIGLHGLRHSTATHMAMSGGTAVEIMQALGHRNLATAQNYIHRVESHRQRIADKAAAVAMAGMAQAEGKPAAEVAPLRKVVAS